MTTGRINQVTTVRAKGKIGGRCPRSSPWRGGARAISEVGALARASSRAVGRPQGPIRQHGYPYRPAEALDDPGHRRPGRSRLGGETRLGTVCESYRGTIRVSHACRRLRMGTSSYLQNRSRRATRVQFHQDPHDDLYSSRRTHSVYDDALAVKGPARGYAFWQNGVRTLLTASTRADQPRTSHRI